MECGIPNEVQHFGKKKRYFETKVGKARKSRVFSNKSISHCTSEIYIYKYIFVYIYRSIFLTIAIDMAIKKKVSSHHTILYLIIKYKNVIIFAYNRTVSARCARFSDTAYVLMTRTYIYKYNQWC